ncbi:hypothetical protein DdX_00977 [Ditylenchus destructor]|uniref:Uncharacterized protein n=1 Tax=Ditylenchus destructor TaxID=166010 RepID=A0AAD4NJR0_9BILA|nr:hypothetical protein DdX_00977 [Ditylenchus destructor]
MAYGSLAIWLNLIGCSRKRKDNKLSDITSQIQGSNYADMSEDMHQTKPAKINERRLTTKESKDKVMKDRKLSAESQGTVKRPVMKSKDSASSLGYKEKSESAERIDKQAKQEDSCDPHYANLEAFTPSKEGPQAVERVKKCDAVAKEGTYNAMSGTQQITDYQNTNKSKTNSSLANKKLSQLKETQSSAINKTEPTVPWPAVYNESGSELPINKPQRSACASDIQSGSQLPTESGGLPNSAVIVDASLIQKESNMIRKSGNPSKKKRM